MRRSIGLLAGLSLAVILIAAAPLYQPTLPGAQAAQTQEQSKAQKWTCPMHPHYIAEEFGQCPICGMDLVKLDTGADAAPGPATGSEPARTAITIAPETLQTTGVRLAKAEKSSFGRIIRSYGIVADNERLQTELTARLEGWIEELKIRAVGDEVKITIDAEMVNK